MEALDGNGVAKRAWDRKRIEAFNEEIFNLLRRTEAGKLTDFTGVVFPAAIAFSGTEEAMRRPLPYISFDAATFSSVASFDGAIFSGHASFRRATFASGASFNGVIFSGAAAFNGATFSDDASFSAATYSSYSSFDGVTFSRGAAFNGATFSGNAGFANATFSGFTYFAGAVFSGHATFDSAFFGSLTWFNGDGTGSPSEFNRISFGPSDKRPCRFKEVADFSNRHFQDAANFRQVVFARAPLFHGSRLHQGTDFTGAQFDDRSGDVAPAYRTLKLAMAEMRARDEEGMFAAREQKCRRKRTDTSGFVKALSYVYDRASGYGQHAGRPILWLAGVILGFFHLYLFGFAPSPSRTFDFEPAMLGEVFRFTLRQIIDPFSAFQKTEDYVLTHAFNDPPLGLALLASVQSMLSLALIALFLLALRWRFRRD